MLQSLQAGVAEAENAESAEERRGLPTGQAASDRGGTDGGACGAFSTFFPLSRVSNSRQAD